jgi:hypothetical protein
MAGVTALLCLFTISAKASPLTNWARGGIATQSTTYAPQGEANRAIDGNTLGGWSDATTTHTADSENTAEGRPWWQVDLLDAKPISHLHLWFREDCCQVRNDNLRIVIFDSTNITTRVVLWETNDVAMNGSVPRDIGYDVTPAVNGRVVYIEHLPDQVADNYICITELEAFNQPLTPPTNYALQGTATSSSCYNGDCTLYGPQQAIDGNHHTWTSITGWPFAYSAPDNTAGADPLPWWQLDLPAAKTVGSVVLWGRHDRTYARYNNIRLTVASQNNTTLYDQVFVIQPTGQKFVVNFAPALANAKIVKIETMDATPDKFLNLPEVEVFAPFASAPALTVTKNLQAISVKENQTPTFGPVEVTVDGGIRPEDISYRWYRNGVEIPGLAGNWLNTYTPGRVGPSSNGDKYQFHASVSGFGIFTSEVVLSVLADTTPPVLQYASGNIGFNKVRVWFSESLDPVSAQKVSNYQLSGGITISSATLSAPAGSTGDNIVDLITSAQTPGQTYTLTVNGVKDPSSAGNTVATDSTVQFTSWTLTSGFLTFEVWNGLSTTDNVLTNTLTVNPRFPNSPDFTTATTAFSTRPVYPDDSHEGYGGRMSGFLIPTETANYTFFLRSDDSSQLFISTDETAAKAVLVAEETGCCQGFLEPDPNQGAAWHDNGNGLGQTTLNSIALVAGKKYYVEALWKEGGGGDYCLVAWRKDGDTTAAASLPAIPGQYLSTYVDANVDIAFTTQPTDQVGVVASTGIEIFSRDFNANDGGFTVEDTEPPVPGPWIYDSTTGAWAADGSTDACGGPFNSRLMSPPYTLTQDGAVSLSFNHRYSFEADRYDGGVVRISVNGGDFTFVPAANFTANGYPAGLIQGNGILKDQQAFHEDSPGYSAGQFITSKVTLGTFSKNDVLIVQFLGGWDECSGAKHPSWVIDSVKMLQLPMTIQDFAKSNGSFTTENSPTTPPAGWGAWTYIATNGQWVANGADSACGGPFNSKLISPAYVVPESDEVTLSFSHRYSFEGDRYDGGQVRISVNGGEFTPIAAASFTANGYAAGVIQGNGILKDQSAFNGDSTGYAAGSFITSSAVLGTFKKNDTLAVQFVGAWDECSGSSLPSWSIKNLQLVFGKAAKASTFTATASATQRGQTVPFNYQWQRNDGTGFVNIAGATGSSYVIYPTTTDMSATFRVVTTVPGKIANSREVKLVTEVVVTPPTIAIAKSGAGITITYTGKLQSSATVNGAYQDVAGAQSPHTVSNLAGAQYFRSVK